MELTENQAAELVELILERLRFFDAPDVVAGIEESRRAGMEETVSQGPSGFQPAVSQADIREVGTIRRRPPTNNEMLRLVLDRLFQRLIVLPGIAHSLQEKLGSEVIWRVDPEFVSSARSGVLQADVSGLLPEELTEVRSVYDRLRGMLEEASGETVANG